MTSEERKEARYQRRKAKRDKRREMRSRACGDYEDVFSFRHLYLSGKKCCKGVYWKSSTQRYIGNIITNTAKIHSDLMNDKFKHKGFHEFDITERGKKRHIKSVHITERVVQKCLSDYCVVPIYSASFIYDNSASLKGKGVDFALRRIICQLQRHYRKHGWNGGILLYDFSDYFGSAPHEPLFRESKRRLHDERIRGLKDSFVKDFGDIGLGLGSQISQTDALILPSSLDHYCKEELGIKGCGRYMDDGYSIHEDIEYLESCLPKIEAKCKSLGLTLNPKKTRIVPLKDGFKFLKTKFILTEKGEIVLKMNRESTTIMRRKLRAFKRWSDEGNFAMADVRSAYSSYQGHLRRGNSYRVLRKTNKHFKNLFGFYPNKEGWLKHV